MRSRFPELLNERGGHELPTGGALTRALREAGFDLELVTHAKTKVVRYLPRRLENASSYLSSSARRRPTGTVSIHRYSDDPQLAAAGMAEDRLRASARRDGFRVLTVPTRWAREAEAELGRDDFGGGVEVVSVAGLFVAALHELVDARPKPTWETILRADVAEPGSRGALKFAEYARTAWGAVEPRVGELVAGAGPGAPVLLTDAGVFARYDAMGVLERLAERSRSGGRGLWLLCPQDDPTRPPRLGRLLCRTRPGWASGSSCRRRGCATRTAREAAGAGTGAF